MNPFYGETQKNLESWLAQCREDLATGKVLTGWGASEASGTSQAIAGLTVERRIELILAELSRIDPEHFPATQCQRTRRTVPRFVWS